MKTLFTEAERQALQEAGNDRERLVRSAYNMASMEAANSLMEITHPSQAPGGLHHYATVKGALASGFKKVIEKVYDKHVAK